MPRVGFICVPHSAALAIEMARAAEDGGLYGIGIGDSQARYMELYSVATACLAATDTLTVGAIVTNPVTRHWTVHAAAARTLDELAPGRFVLGVGAGNSSVRSIGAPAARPEQVAAMLNDVRGSTPAALRLLVATDAPRLAAVAGRLADGLVIGLGLEAAAVADVLGRAERARADAGVDEPLDVWLSVPLIVVARTDELADARRRAVGVAVSMARRSLSTGIAEKHVPHELQAVISDRLERYDMRYHGSVTGSSPNDVLFADRPDVESFLVERFTIVGTPEQCRERVEEVVADTGINSFWFSSLVPDPVSNIRLAARGLSGITT